MNALIVDDSSAMRSILRRIVRKLGFVTSEASNGLEGLEALTRARERSKTFELVLVDWNMPEMNGLELVKTLRADEKFSRLKLVMVTTETEPTQMARALMTGVDEFIMKPFTPDILIEKLRLIGVRMPNAEE